MDLHHPPATCVLRCSHRLRLPEIARAAAPVRPVVRPRPGQRPCDRRTAHFSPATNLPKDPQTRFDWAACLPVAQFPSTPEATPSLPSGPYKRAVLPPLRCAHTVFTGPLAGLFTHDYQPLLRAIIQAGLRPSGAGHEVYHA